MCVSLSMASSTCYAISTRTSIDRICASREALFMYYTLEKAETLKERLTVKVDTLKKRLIENIWFVMV